MAKQLKHLFLWHLIYHMSTLFAYINLDNLDNQSIETDIQFTFEHSICDSFGCIIESKFHCINQMVKPVSHLIL